jgi:hypothetical protein
MRTFFLQFLMMDIKPLRHLPPNFNAGWGDSGYVTAKVYEVSVTNGQQGSIFQLQETARFYKKSYPVDAAAIVAFNEIIKNGQSFGAMTAQHLPGSPGILLVMPMKTGKETFGLVQKGIMAKFGRFRAMMRNPCLIKSQR